jgi:hypothetical protein
VLIGVTPGNLNSRSKLAGFMSNTMFLSGIEKFNRKLEQFCTMYEEQGFQAEIIRIPKDNVTLLILIGEKASR